MDKMASMSVWTCDEVDTAFKGIMSQSYRRNSPTKNRHKKKEEKKKK